MVEVSERIRQEVGLGDTLDDPIDLTVTDAESDDENEDALALDD
jgi:hypothetical protein